MARVNARTVALRVASLALLLLLVLVAVLAIRTARRLPDTLIYMVRSEPTVFRLDGVPRSIGARDAEGMVEQAALALMEGPTAAEVERGLSTSVPPDTRLLGLELDGDTVTVDLSADFARGGGSAAMQARLYQLFYTLTQPNGIDAVHLLVEGEPVTLFGGEGIMVPQPWRRSEHEGLPIW